MPTEPTQRSTRRDYRERVLRVLVHIQDHLDDELALDDLAAIACFSPFHFHRVFRGMVGEPVARHVRRLRLERAAYRLQHTGQGVLEIALDAGYENHAAFSRAFQGAFGCSPSAFRATRTPSVRLDSAAAVHFTHGQEAPAFEPVHQEDDTMDVEIRSLGPMRIAFLRHVGPYDQVGTTWERLTDWVGRECLFGSDTHFFGRCWDDPEVTPPEKLRYDACVTVGADAEPAGEIGLTTVEERRYAVMLHEGPYEGLGGSYAELLGGWFPRSGQVPGEPPSLEFYLTDPEGTEPEDLLTEICMPIGEMS